MGFSISMSGPAAPRGGTLVAAIDGLDAGVEATVSLVVVERLNGTIPSRRRPVVSQTVTGGLPVTARLAVPLDFPEPHEFAFGSLALEVEAVRERRGPDERATIPFEVAPGMATDHDRRLVGRHAPPPTGTVAAHPWHHGLAAKAGTLAVAAVLIALFVDGLLRWVGVVGAAVALVLSVLGEAGRGRKVPVGLGYTVAANPVRRGDDLEVRLTAPPGMMDEVGVRIVEVTIAGSPGRSRSTNRTVIDEQWAPAPTASRAAVRIPADAIPTYIGEWLSIRHEVVLHPAELPREDARGDITVEVAVVP